MEAERVLASLKRAVAHDDPSKTMVYVSCNRH